MAGHSDPTRAPLRSALPVVERLLPDFDAHVQRLSAAILRAAPEIDERGRGLLTLSTGQALHAAIEYVVEGDEGAPPLPPQVMLDYVRGLAWTEESLEPFVVGFRAGEREFLSLWAREALALPSPQDELRLALSAGHEVVIALMDGFLQVCTREYDAALATRQADAAAQQMRTVTRLLGGGPASDVAGTEQVLRYGLGATHVAAVVSSIEAASANAPDSQAQVDLAVQHVLAALRSLTRPLVVTRPEATWLWVHLDGAEAAEGLKRATEVKLAPSLRCGLGEPAPGVAGFRQSHGDALEAHRLATSLRRAPSKPLGYARHAMIALLIANPERALRFAHLTLGPLAASDERTARLRSTLRLFLEEAGSYAKVARRVGIHAHTVRYRIEQATALIDDPHLKRRKDLEAALLVFDAIGPAQDDAA